MFKLLQCTTKNTRFFFNFANMGYVACFSCRVKGSNMGSFKMKHSDLSSKEKSNIRLITSMKLCSTWVIIPYHKPHFPFVFGFLVRFYKHTRVYHIHLSKTLL